MSRTIKILTLFVLGSINCIAQNEVYIPYIPKGHIIFDTYFSDLNKDGLEDCVLIIKKTDKKNIVTNRFNKKVDRNRRGIIALLKNGTNYEVVDQNYDCFSSENEDGGVYFPPDLWIDFNRGNLIVHYGHGRYDFWRYIFRYQDLNFKLIGYDASYNRGPVIITETSINFLTKKKLIRKNTNAEATDGDEIFKETWHNIKIDQLIQLSDIKDFDELDMSNY